MWGEKWLQRIKRFLIRCLLYHLVLLWAFTKINNVEKNNPEFKKKILMNYQYYNGAYNKDLDDFLEDPIILFCLCALELCAGLVGIFGYFYGHIFSAILFGVTNLIYYNPMLPGHEISFYDTRIEIFFNFGILLCLLLAAYYPSEESNTKVIQKVETVEEDDEEDEAIEEETVKN